MRELLSGLSHPAAFPRAGDRVEVVQTHISVVFLTGDRVYKIKKPLSLWGFLDYSTIEKRRFYCQEEVRLNRRLAPDVYIGVLPVVRRDGRLAVGGEGEVVDWAVEMVRIPEGATLLERSQAGHDDPADLDAIADVLAKFHASAARGDVVRRTGRPVAFARILAQNLRATRAFVPVLFGPRAHAALAERLAACLRRSRDVMARRCREGRLVEGHGDLRCEHVVKFADGWGAIDGVEFTPLLRCIDPLSDVAFLAMDLVASGFPKASDALVEAYLARRPDPDARALLPLFLAYRAHVRAKVDAHRASEVEIPAADRETARRSALLHLALAWSYAGAESSAPLVLVVGTSGTGKSVMARFLALPIRAEVISSDLVRKRLAGLAPTERVTGEALARLYAKATSERTYARMLFEAETTLTKGRPAILDATYLTRARRAEARLLAARLGRPFAIVHLDADAETIRSRLAARAAADTDPSDATYDVYRRQVGEFEAFDDDERPHLVRHAAGTSSADVLAPLLERLG